MSEFVTGVTFGGTEWTPSYVNDLNQLDCIGCGRCFKVCPRDVFDLIERDEAFAAEDLDDDFDDDDDNTMVMSLKNPADCIGCQACSKVCPKSCFTHEHKLAA